MAPCPFFLCGRKYERIADSTPNPPHKKNYKRIDGLSGSLRTVLFWTFYGRGLLRLFFVRNTSCDAISPFRSLVWQLGRLIYDPKSPLNCADCASPPCAASASYLRVYCFMYGWKIGQIWRLIYIQGFSRHEKSDLHIMYANKILRKVHSYIVRGNKILRKARSYTMYEYKIRRK